MPLTTTLGFNGRTEEALDFYKDVLGADILFLMRFKDAPLPKDHQEAHGELIFHATFRIDGTTLMASDVGRLESNTQPVFSGFSLALQIDRLDRGREIYDGLAETGTVVLEFAESKFTDWYGIVVDQFGISWKINVNLSE